MDGLDIWSLSIYIKSIYLSLQSGAFFYYISQGYLDNRVCKFKFMVYCSIAQATIGRNTLMPN
jgi:hypothetical protein